MTRFLDDDVEVLEAGALDGLSLNQVREYRPDNGMSPLVSRMRDGTEVIIAKEKLLPRIERAVYDLDSKKVSLILLLCVGRFPRYESSCLVVEPQRVVDRSIESLIDETRHLGILIPIPEQEAWVREHYSRVTPRITVADASPYAARGGLSRAGEILEEANCDLIVMYCMGFNRTFAGEIRRMTGKPVILSSSIVARTLGELLE